MCKISTHAESMWKVTECMNQYGTCTWLGILTFPSLPDSLPCPPQLDPGTFQGTPPGLPFSTLLSTEGCKWRLRSSCHAHFEFPFEFLLKHPSFTLPCSLCCHSPNFSPLLVILAAWYPGLHLCFRKEFRSDLVRSEL